MRNIYDNSEFFAAYAEMGRSKDGLKAAGVNGKIKCTDFRHQECTLTRQELLSFSPQSAHFHHSW